MDKSELVGVLESMADLMEIESDNPFRSRAFRSASRAIESLAEDFSALVESGAVAKVPGVGASLAREIEELYRSGDSARFRQLREAVPAGVVEMLAIPGLGPKRIRLLWRELGLADVSALEAACRKGEVAKLKGFGAKTVDKILAGIEYRRSVAGRFLVPEAEATAQRILAHLSLCPAVGRAEVAGSFRRRCETVGDLDVVASTQDAGYVAAHFLKLDEVAQVVASGATKTSVRLTNGMAVDVRLVGPDEFPFALAYFTGSKDHNTRLRARATDRGLKLNEYGLFRGDDRVACRDEAEIYAALGLAFVPPELREDRGELDLAAAGGLPVLVEERDLRGAVHVHTTYSDGVHGLEEIVEAARARGLEYLGVTDHSQSAFYAGGLTAADLERQHKEIDGLNVRLRGFRIFKGIESDIRADGSLDYPTDVLDRFDFVVASIHSSMSLDEREMTERVLRALRDPHTTILGHMTGRLLLRRESFALDADRVLQCAAELGVAVEINANPYRLELDWRLGPRARELGLLTSIDPDAHSVGGLDDVRFGVGIARKAGFEAARVVNTYSAADFAAFISRRR